METMVGQASITATVCRLLRSRRPVPQGTQRTQGKPHLTEENQKSRRASAMTTARTLTKPQLSEFGLVGLLPTHPVLKHGLSRPQAAVRAIIWRKRLLANNA